MEFVKNIVRSSSSRGEEGPGRDRDGPSTVERIEASMSNPSTALTLKASALFDEYLTGPQETVVGLKLVAATIEDETRNPVDIVVALDISGSMRGEKLRMCKKTIEILLRELKEDDSFGLITFSDKSNCVFEPMKCSKANKEMMMSKVSSVTDQGCTNLSGGLFEALEVEAKVVGRGKANSIRSIFLLTDGMANRGISEPDMLLTTLRNVLKTDEKKSGTSIYCFGYGSDTNADLLRGISEAAGPGMGSYYFIESEDMVGSAFADALGGLLSVVAQNVEIKATGVQGTKVLNCISHPGRNNDGTLEIKIGDLFAEESRDMIFKVLLPQISTNDSLQSQLVNFQVTCISVIHKNPQKISVDLSTRRVKKVSSEGMLENADLAVQQARLEVKEAIETARNLAERDDMSNARAVIDSAQTAIKNLKFQDDPLVEMLGADIEETRTMLQNRSEYEQRGRHYMSSKIQSHQEQRCQETRSDEQLTSKNVYRGAKKSAMRAKWTG